MPIRAALYCRVSTEEQAREGVSLAAQEARLTAYCKSQGWLVHGLYVDDGYSGKDTHRPALGHMPLDKLTPMAIQKFCADKLHVSVTPGSRTRAPAGEGRTRGASTVRQDYDGAVTDVGRED